MTAQSQPLSRGNLRQIRALHVVSGDGQVAELRSVRCPAVERAVSLERCAACPDGGGVVEDPVTQLGYVACRSAAGERPDAAAAVERGRGRGQTPVHRVMTSDVLAVRPDVSLEVLADLLLERGIGGAPVVDADARPIGVVSKTDVVGERLVAGDTAEAMGPGQHAGRGHYRVELAGGFHVETAPRAAVADAMTPAAFTIAEDAPLSEAAALLASHGIHRLPVVSHDGQVVGIVTSSDVVRWVAQEGGYLASPRIGTLSPAS